MSKTNQEQLEFFKYVFMKNYAMAKSNGSEEAAKDSLITIFENLRHIIMHGDFSYADKFPHVKEDIELVVGNYKLTDEENQLTDNDYEALILEVLDFDYSDYNDQIASAVSDYQKIAVD